MDYFHRMYLNLLNKLFFDDRIGSSLQACFFQSNMIQCGSYLHSDKTPTEVSLVHMAFS
jgi:hypothetical protein